MGKKTDKFIAAAETQHGICKTEMNKCLIAAEEMARVVKLIQAEVPKLNTRFDELKVIHKDPEKLRLAMLSDAQYMHDDHQISALEQLVEQHRRNQVKARSDLAASLFRLKAGLEDFEKYIGKKAKSKNPFKSKKSIPAARDFIAASKTFQENSQTYATSIA